ncbi:multicopper oxidase domain-containing protein [Isosphaeraceae bacterium EP7]
MINRRSMLKATAMSVLAGGAKAQELPGPYDDPTARFDKAKQDQLPSWAFRDELWIPLVPRPVNVGWYDALTSTPGGTPPPFSPTDPVPIGHVFHGIAREWGETPLHWKDLGCRPEPGQTASQCWSDKHENMGFVESYERKENGEAVELIHNWGHFPIKCFKMPILETKKALAHAALPARLYGYGGMVPGPTMKMRLGQPVVVRFENHLETELSVHLHGAHSPSHSDGFPSFYVLQGKSRDYFYPNILPLRKPMESDKGRARPMCLSPHKLVADDGESQSTMWYHDHGMDGTGYNVAKGLAGFALCFGERELELIANGTLPGLGPKSCEDPERQGVKTSARDVEDLEEPGYPGYYKRCKEPYANPFDIPIVLQDKVIDPNTGQVAYETAGHNGYLGHTFLLNGVAYPHLNVSNRKYRFRFLNGSNSRIYRLRLLSEAEFHARFGGQPASVPAAVPAEVGVVEADDIGGGSMDEASLPFLRIGKDSWLWSKAEQKKSVVLAMANRADLVVDFKLFASHLKSRDDQAVFYLVNTMPQADGRGPRVKLEDGGDPRVLPLPIDVEADAKKGIPESKIAELDRPIPLMKIIVKGPPLDCKLDAKVEHGTELIPHHPIGDDEVQVVREFIFERGKGAWKVNGRFYDPNIANATPTIGTAEEWILRNGGGGWWHPIHIHLESHQLISYQKDFEADGIIDTGDPPAIPRLANLVELVDKFDEGQQRGLHDTQVLGPNTVARIRMRFRTWNGPFVFHCHNLEHEDMRMMHNFEPVPRPFTDAEAEGKPDRFDRRRKLANIAPDARTHGNDVTLQPDPSAPGYHESHRRIGELDWSHSAIPTTPVEDGGAYQIPPRAKEGR